MIGVFPIAGAPLAAGQDANPAAASQSLSFTLNSVALVTDQTLQLASQSLALTESPVYVSDDDVIDVAGQVLLSTLNGVALSTGVDITLDSQAIAFTENPVQVEVQPPEFTSQSIALVQNSVSYITDTVLTPDSQSVNITLNSVGYGAGVTVAITPIGEITYGDEWAIAAQPLCSLTPLTPLRKCLGFTENSVSLNLDAVLMAPSYQLATTVNSVSLITDQNIVAPSQTIYTTLNGLRLWQDIDTEQPGNCPDHCDGLWTTIAFDEQVYGDDFAIASQPIGCLPQILPPIRKYPGTPWGSIATNTTTTWTNIPT